jgi:hypothetical protein
MSLPDHVKEGIKAAVEAMDNGTMKPGDTMILSGEKEKREPGSDSDPELDSLASDFFDCFERKDKEGLKALLSAIRR